MPHRNLKSYASLRPLLRDYRDLRGITQKDLAEEVGIDLKTVNRWETETNPPRADSLLQFARNTLFPFELLLRLRHGMPTLYSITSHRMAYSPFDTDFVNRKLLQQELFHPGLDTSVEITDAITSMADLLKQKSRMYTRHRWVSDSVIARAGELAGPLNLVAHGYGRTYVGHILTFPVNARTYRALRSQELQESRIDTTHLLDLRQAAPLGALHIYSFHASTSQVAYALVQRFVLAIRKWWDGLERQGCFLTRYPVTEDGRELAKKFGLQPVFLDNAEQARLKTEIVPEFREALIGGDHLRWIAKYLEESPST